MTRPRKRFGQNFLHDRQVIERIVAAIDPQPEDFVLEIGPGRGALTRRLFSACKLTVVEIDRDLAGELRADEELAGLEIIESDVLEIDLSALGTKLRLVGNLPYNVSTPIIFWALGQLETIRDMHFMLQKEVVDRMAAPPGGKDYGRLSVMVQYCCRVTPLFRVPPGAFFPAPRVQSAVFRLTPLADRVAVATDEVHFAKVVRYAFQQRRKTVANALKRLVAPATLEAAGVDPRSRAEQLSVADFVAIANQR